MSALSTPNAVRSSNWSGSIPIVLTLSATSLSSPTMPPPIHILVPRNTYLHIGLEQAVLRLYQFAATVLSFSGVKQEEPAAGSSDDETPAAAESDSEPRKNPPSTSSNHNSDKNSSSDNEYPPCWFEDEDTSLPLRWHLFTGILWDLKQQQQQQRQASMPWRITLHFGSSYPSSQILTLDAGVKRSVEHIFKNSLKQALFLQYGNSKASMNMTKQSYQQLWDSVQASNYRLYQQVSDDLQRLVGDPPVLIPVRIFLNSKPALQRPCSPQTTGAESSTKTEDRTTLGSMLMDWFPKYFDTATTCKPIVTWYINGISPSLSSPVLELWKLLSHPDQFLYVILLTTD